MLTSHFHRCPLRPTLALTAGLLALTTASATAHAGEAEMQGMGPRFCSETFATSERLCTEVIRRRPIIPELHVAYDTCRAVAEAARSAGTDPTPMVALSWHESKFDPDAISYVDARGPLQVMPHICEAWKSKFGAPGGYSGHPQWEGCDLIAAGVWVWKRWRARSRNVRHAACRYTAGYRCRPNTLAHRWAGEVDRLYTELKKAVDA